MKKTFLFYVALVLLKILLSVPFESPWVFGDDAIYTAKTRAILQGNFHFDEFHYGGPKVPPLYSIALLPAYFFENPAWNYHLILVINALLSSAIIFPAFFIGRRFLKEGASILTALLVSVYPSSFGFTYMVMSENLFFPLLLVSAWLLLITFEKKSLFYEMLLGLSLGALVLTRVVGVFPIVAYLAILLFTFSPRKLVSLIFIFLPLFWWFFLEKGAGGLESSGGYKISHYLQAVSTILSSKSNFLKALSLTFSQLGFVFIVSYIISIPLAIFGVLRKTFRSRRQKKFRLLFLFTLLNFILFLGASIAHQFLFSQKDAIRYLVFGRYIEPLIPLIIFLGTLVFFRISKELRLRTRLLLLASVFLLAIFANEVLPQTDYDLVNNITLLAYRPYEIMTFDFRAFIWLLFFGLFGLCVLFPKKFYKRLFISGMILISLVAFQPLYLRELSSSRDWAKKLDAYHWVASNAEKGEVIGFDRTDLWKDNLIHSFWLYEFWFGKKYHLKVADLEEASRSEGAIRYFISPRDLNFEKVFSGKSLAVYRLQST